eukprot:TRINITY_DN68_c0_g1_i13.p1 TRINITY_DN68_c0_g1~~TRINITY_DN68_c0_g1_i13.p1  ORF type:complete len:1094 (-),score=78.92 TRINITY_DN68_c0_g1_i13:769-4050(-)
MHNCMIIINILPHHRYSTLPTSTKPNNHYHPLIRHQISHLRQTQKHMTRCTHHGNIRILPHNSPHTLTTYAVSNKHLKHNLLSVNDLANRYGLVLFTPRQGYIINTQTKPPKIVAEASWTNNQYQLSGKVSNAYTSRTIARKHQHKISIKNKPSRPTTIPHKNQKPSSQPPQHKTNNNIAPPITPLQKKQQGIRILATLNNPHRHRQPSAMEQTQHNWHIRLNHAHPTKIAATAKHRLIPILPSTLAANFKMNCSACQQAKLHPTTHKRTNHNYGPGVYISSDTCGPIKPTSTHGNNHLLLLICAASRYAIAHFVKHRKDIPTNIDRSLHHIQHRMRHPLHHFRTDNAKEYLSAHMQTIYDKYKVQHHTTTPHQPQENSIAERFNRTIMNSVRALLTTAQLGAEYWEDAAKDTIFKYNIMHHSAIDTSPYHMWHGSLPNLQRIFTFGQLGTVPVFSPKKKLEPRADPARYMYPTTLHHVVIINLRTNQYQQIRALDFHPYHKTKDPTQTSTNAYKARANTRAQTPTNITVHTPPPATLQQARHYPDAPNWKKAHDDELENLDQHDSIQWLPRDFVPPKEAVIPLMMLYRYKRSADGTILQRKARCNLRGDLMQPGLHFDPKNITTYTADRTTQRLLIAAHVTYKFPLEHFDIKSAYLHEKYEHDRPVYVKQMPNFDGTYRHEGQYGKLVGNLYGSPPAAYFYNHGLKKFLTKLGFTSSEHDPCLYIKESPTGNTLVSTTIDDFLILGQTQKHIDELYAQLLQKYKVKRLGKPTRFLGWTVTHLDNGDVHVAQPDAIDAILEQTNMQYSNPSQTPYNALTHLDQHKDTPYLTPEQATHYRQILGEIRYITDSTRPDLIYATNRLAQHMNKPQKHHQQALKTLIRYLRGTRSYGLLYKSTKYKPSERHKLLKVYSDADFANSSNRKSVTGNVHLFNSTPVSWFSRKQNIVALSTTEAEYISATNATQHTKWLRRLLHSAGLLTHHPTTHYVDNQSAVLIAENQAPTKRKKYLDLRYHYLQHQIGANAIQLKRIPTAEMLADIFTKPLHRSRFQGLRNQMHIVPNPRTNATQQPGTVKHHQKDFAAPHFRKSQTLQ